MLSGSQHAMLNQKGRNNANKSSLGELLRPTGGHPPQTQITADRAVFTEAYALIPKGVMRDIVTSNLPFWEGTRLWVLARPLSGFAETFSQYIMEVQPQGGSDKPEPDHQAEGVLFIVEGELTLTLSGERHTLQPGGYAFIPPGSSWQVRNESNAPVRFHWVRKAYEFVEGLEVPQAFVTNEQDIAPSKCRALKGAGPPRALSTLRMFATICT
ncbi:hypothetical protein HORIV_53600 [Vreelandella olivaria]|uniref:Cupin type-2 domain-containing protein n=1 Tax=Vreelandella olivaria TaxID=390919 RepID=A0ABM7GQE4_9GAMM|nr:hypothetical protein HORIV_53600 [Halomonas olivaria]